MLDPLVRSLEVPCSQEMAFDVFVNLDRWWPKDKFATAVMRGAAVEALRVEPREGGAIVEVGTDGRETVWGRFKIYQPHDTLNLDFHVPHPSEEEPGFTTVEVRFTPLAADRTRVELTQSNWEALGDVAEMVIQGYGQAWGMIFEGAYLRACGG